MNLRPYINWMQRFTIYETPDYIFIVGSDATEKLFRIMSISRKPDGDCNEPTLSAETKYDITWRIKINTCSQTYTGAELTSFLQSVKTGSAVNRSPSSGIDQSDPNVLISHIPSAVSVGIHQPLNKSLTGVGLIGFIRFLFGYYLIVVTQHREVARIGEHRIYKIEDTKMLYIPRDIPFSSTTSDESGNGRNMQSDESKYLKMFQGVELNRDFYFSYTYDLTKSLQVNMEPLGIMGTKLGPFDKPTAFRSTPDPRFLWNYSLIPQKFQPTSEGISNWFIGLIHGFVRQALLVSYGMPVSIILLARRSRFFAGTRFLKRGANIDGNVANEVETEQIVCDTTEPTLSRMRVSSVVQYRGSVPLFWSQDTAKLMVGKPPLAITWEDPYYEAFGKHFADLIERHCVPVIVLNLMKQQEKRPFEKQLTAGFLEGIEHLNQYASKLDSSVPLMDNEEKSTPITYVAFDMARIKRSTNSLAIDHLLEVAEECIRATGIFFSGGLKPVSDTFSREEYIERTRQLMSIDVCPRQHGIVRTNCVDCLDRTNTAQFVLGHVAIGYQLHAIGLLANTKLSFDSKVSKVLRDLFGEHGDMLALQYGGSGVVHNIETYQNPSTSRVNSRDILQTLSRYYSNNFIDFEKQLTTDLFLRVFRPGAGPQGAEWGPDPRTIAATSSVRAGLAFLLTSDPAFEAYMHWLFAWASIPPYREPLDAWLSRKVFEDKQRVMRGWDNSVSPNTAGLDDKDATDHQVKGFKLIDLKEDDPGGDWYSELYRPHDWTHFYDLKYHQLPLALSSIYEDNNSHIKRASVNIAPVTSRIQYQSRLPSHSSSMVLGVVDENEEKSGCLGCLSNSPKRNLAVNEEVASSSNIKTEDTCPSSTPVPEVPSMLSRIFQHRAEAASTTSKLARSEASFTSTAEGSTETSTLFGQSEGSTSPLLVRFSQIRLSDLASRVEMKGRVESSRSRESLSGDFEDEKEKDYSPTQWSRKSPSPRSHRRYELSSINASIKLRKASKCDMEKYKKYASIPAVSVHTPLSEVLTVDSASMKIYKNTVKLAQAGALSIPNESLQVYRKIADVKRLYA
ncbi:unnamed protein product [Hymenolepis diminuta]|uniref:SAC domain-containing protein n=1 Tax=Hymenolepis diminuta TaxID=6216 RepID=A0A564Z7H0_HYMDI|nr:unnamed protein product [Hymenolepis diminuta]